MKILEILSYPIRDTKSLFSFCMLMELVILAACHIVGEGGNVFLNTFLPIFDCYLICLTASLLKKIRLGWIIWVIAVLTFGGELLSVFIYKSSFNIRVIQLIMETNPGEAKEFFASTCSQPGFWIWAVTIIITYFMSVVLWNIHNRFTKTATAILGYLGITIILWSGIRQLSAYTKLGRCFAAKEYRLLAERKYMPHLSTTFVRLLHGIAFNKVQSTELNVLVETVRATQELNSTNECPLIVLIIGESFSKYHTPLYAPDAIPTNPRLSRLRQDGNLIPYTDVVTTSNLTSNVMRNMFSMWDGEYSDNWTRHTLFPAIFRKAGYTVWYLTNQFALNSTELWNNIGGTIFNKPEMSECLFDWRNENLKQYDGELFDLMPDTASLFKTPTLLIVHLMGQHVNYKERYPREFEHFSANQVNNQFGGAKGRQVISEYANATLYNDYVVDSIWSIVKKHDAVGIYLSDHGEEVYDWRDFYERSDESQMSANVAKYQFEIPFFFLMSDTFIQKHGQLAQSIRDCYERPLINSEIKHTLIRLAGIESPEYKPTHDILSDKFDSKLPRYIGNHINYDTLF